MSGIGMPSISTGTAAMSRADAAPISIRMKSLGFVQALLLVLRSVASNHIGSCKIGPEDFCPRASDCFRGHGVLMFAKISKSGFSFQKNDPG
jgi:hypothetical protein